MRWMGGVAILKPILFNTKMVRAILDGRKTVTRRRMKLPHCGYFEHEPPLGVVPPYRPGDILYVRETWTRDGDVYRYKAGFYDQSRKWRPSIHMPREAARIFLRVTDVRVDRLQECGKGWCLDIEREGIVTPQDPILYINDDEFHGALRKEFKKVWDSTIKPSDRVLYGWEANPYVWVIKFERCDKPEGG